MLRTARILDRLRWFAAIGILISAALGQTPTFSTEVDVVSILATVRGRDGRLIQDLTKYDFRVFEDGRPQTIRYFASKAETPLTVTLLVDTSNSQDRLLAAEGRTAAQFMKRILRPGNDSSLIARFDHDIRILQDLSAVPVDTDALLDNLTNPKFRAGGGTHLFGAVYSICNQKLSARQGRKVMIILSDGFDVGSPANIADAEGMAIKNDVVIYSILFSDPKAYVGYADHFAPAKGALIMKNMADVTGGGYFEPSKERTVGQIFDLLAEDLRGQYSIGYISDQPITKTGFRKLKVITDRPDALVVARKSYFVGKKRG
jgi:VWFA-related protein